MFEGMMSGITTIYYLLLCSVNAEIEEIRKTAMYTVEHIASCGVETKLQL